MGKGPRPRGGVKGTADAAARGVASSGVSGSTALIVAVAAAAAAWVFSGGGGGSGGPQPTTPAPSRASVKRLNKIATFEEANPDDATEDALAWLLQPLDPDTWMRSHWDSKPALMRRPARLYAPLSAGLGSVDALLRVQRQVERTPLLMHPTSGHSQADCSSVIGGMDNRTANYAGVHHAYLNGATIVCNIVPSYWGPLASLMKGLADATGHQFMANMYLSPRGSQGFTAHTDNKDGFIIHVAGSKRWVVYEGTGFPRPLRHQMRGRPHERPVGPARGKLVFDEVLTAGDLLHLPRGYVHYAAAAAESHALHYTISATKNMEWADFLDGYVAGFAAATAGKAEAEPLARRATEIDEKGSGAGVDSRIAAAVRAELGEETTRPSAGWLRGSLPFHYSSVAHRPALIAALDTVLAQAQLLAERRVARIEGMGKKEIKVGLTRLFEALRTAGPARDAAITAVLEKNGVYTDYVRNLVNNGLDVAQNHRDYLGGAITDGTTVAVTAAAPERGPGLLNPGLDTARLGGEVALFTGAAGGVPIVKVRWNAALRDAVAFVAAQPAGVPFAVGAMPGEDVFENACLVRMLVGKNVLHRVAEELEDAASVLGVGA